MTRITKSRGSVDLPSLLRGGDARPGRRGSVPVGPVEKLPGFFTPRQLPDACDLRYRLYDAIVGHTRFDVPAPQLTENP